MESRFIKKEFLFSGVIRGVKTFSFAASKQYYFVAPEHLFLRRQNSNLWRQNIRFRGVRTSHEDAGPESQATNDSKSRDINNISTFN